MMRSLAFLALLSSTACTVATTTSPPPRGPTVVRDDRDRRPPPRHDHDRDHDRDEPRVLVGRITDARTGAPLDRAAVDVVTPLVQGEITVNTGPDGRYRTRELPPGDVKVRCRRDGYESINREVRVDRGTAVMDCPMQRKR